MILLEDRAVLAIEGVDKFTFLQGLITNDIKPLETGESNLIYSAMLTPQGKIRFDFFLFLKDNILFIDAAAYQANDIRKTLNIYKLRADIKVIEHPELCVVASFNQQKNMQQDPRLLALGFRDIVTRESLIGEQLHPALFYHTKRIELGIPDAADFISDRAYIAEYGLDSINAVSFTKGCYIGQEIVARTKHKGTVHKVLHKVATAAGTHLPEAGTSITTNGKEIGQLRTSIGNKGLAIIRRDKLKDNDSNIIAGGVILDNVYLPEWFN